MKLKKILLIVLVALISYGCSKKPVYYSDSEVDDYVHKIFGTEYNLIEKKAYPVKDDEENSEYEEMIYEYIYGNNVGFTFSVYNQTTNPSIDASSLPYYEKSITDNYQNSRINFYLDEIKNISNNYSFEVEYDVHISFYLNSYTEINDAAKLATIIDSIISFEYDNDNWIEPRSSLSEYINIYLKPDNLSSDENWKESYKYKIASIELSHSKDNRHTTKEIRTTIKQNLKDIVKEEQFNNKDLTYNVPDNFLYDY